MKQILYFTKQLYKFSGKILIYNLLGMVFISLLDGLGILLLIPMLNLSGIFNINLGSTSTSWGFLSTFDSYYVNLSLPFILGIYLSIVLIQNLLQQNLTIRNAKIQQGYFRYLRMKTYNSLLQANWNFFIKKRKSDLVNSLTSELARVNSGTNLVLQLLSSFIFTIIQIVIAFMLSVKMTLFVLLCGIVLVMFSRTFIRRARALGTMTTDLSQQYLAGITDHFNGIKDIKSNSLEKSRMNWFQNLTNKIFIEQVEYIKLRSTSQIYYKVASAFLIVSFIFLSVKFFNAQMEQLIIIILLFSRLWPKFTGIQLSMEQLASIIPAFVSVINLQEQCDEAKELKNTSIQSEEVKPIHINYGIECREVFFRYNPNKSLYALQNINLQIPTNSMTAIVGRSGAGKSTLIDILMGLLDPEKGNVLIDGTQLSNENVLSLRQSISYVPQDPFLFNGTIRENLLMIQPNAHEEQIWDALHFSAAANFVKRLPLGLDTMIGDRGIRLSGGERQRLVLARAILKKPSILILDEATSALDSENEVKIQEAIERLKGNLTIIVIAHRLSTIKNADQVIVLDDGKVIQQGGFTQLATDKRGVFNNLLEKQREAVL